jgi:hypothetical protein
MSKKDKENKTKKGNFMVKLPLLYRTKMSELAHERYISMQELFNLAVIEILKANHKI